jgi:glutathione S-transferase
MPQDADGARETRFRDRFFDLYVQLPMQKIVIDRLRPEGSGDALGVEQALGQLRTALDIAEADMAGKTWATGDSFSMADCAAAPALYYANLVLPFKTSHPRTGAYLARLNARPSFARAVAEAAPYRAFFPDQKKT